MAQYIHVVLAKSATLSGTTQDIVGFEGTGFDIKVTNRSTTLGLWFIVADAYPTDAITAGGDGVYYVAPGKSSEVAAKGILEPYVRLLGDGAGGNSYTVEASYKTNNGGALAVRETYSTAQTGLGIANDDTIDLSDFDLDTGGWSALGSDAAHLLLPQGLFAYEIYVYDYSASNSLWVNAEVGFGSTVITLPMNGDALLGGIAGVVYLPAPDEVVAYFERDDLTPATNVSFSMTIRQIG